MLFRSVKALQMADCSKGSTAANWMPDQPVIVPPPKTFAELEERNKEIQENQNGINWYLSFENPPQKCLEKRDEK